MFISKCWSLTRGNSCFAVSTACCALVMFLACGSATAVTVSFETGEGFPDGDGASISGSVPAGVVTGWSLTGDGNKGTGGFEIDHGPGGTGFGDEANPLTGSQFGLARGDDNGEIILTMDLDNAASNTLQSLYYANRGTYPPQLTLEYYGLDENLLGSDVFTAANPNASPSAGVGLGPAAGNTHGYNQHFQLIEPTSLFAGKAMSKVVMRSHSTGGTGSGHFAVEDITLAASSGVVLTDYVVGFETSEGYNGTDGGPVTANGLVTDWGLAGAGVGTLVIDQGPGGTGFGDEDNPPEGSQFAMSMGSGNGEHIVTMDLVNSANLSLQSFHYANRGNFPPKLTVEYFGLDEQSLGTEVFTEGSNGGVAVGLSAGYGQKFQLITASAQFQNAPLSKVVFTSEHDSASNLGGHFSLDAITFKSTQVIPEPGSLALLALAGIGLVGLRKRLS